MKYTLNDLNIRTASEKDLKEITEIFNQAINTGTSVAYTVELTVEERIDWLNTHTKNEYPVLVAENEERILGWVSVSPYREGRAALKKTVEISYFVHNKFKQKGIGSVLLNEMLKKVKQLGYTTVFAIVFDINSASINLLEKNGFVRWGFLPGVAEIDGKIISHIYYGKKLS